MIDEITINNSIMTLQPTANKKTRNSGAAWFPVLSISNNNEKMGAAVASVSFAIECTCSDTMPCFKECYAHRMENYKPSVYNAWLNNYLIYKHDKQLFYNSVKAAMLTNLYFRWFVGGDIPDAEFMPMVFRLCAEVPHCKVLLFTKKYWFVNDAITQNGGTLPENLSIVLSEWEHYKINNPYGLPVARVYNNANEMTNDIYQCMNNCTICNATGRGCWYAQPGDIIGFIKH